MSKKTCAEQLAEVTAERDKYLELAERLARGLHKTQTSTDVLLNNYYQQQQRRFGRAEAIEHIHGLNAEIIYPYFNTQIEINGIFHSAATLIILNPGHDITVGMMKPLQDKLVGLLDRIDMLNRLIEKRNVDARIDATRLFGLRDKMADYAVEANLDVYGEGEGGKKARLKKAFTALLTTITDYKPEAVDEIRLRRQLSSHRPTDPLTDDLYARALPHLDKYKTSGTLWMKSAEAVWKDMRDKREFDTDLYRYWKELTPQKRADHLRRVVNRRSKEDSA